MGPSLMQNGSSKFGREREGVGASVAALSITCLERANKFYSSCEAILDQSSRVQASLLIEVELIDRGESISIRGTLALLISAAISSWLIEAAFRPKVVFGSSAISSPKTCEAL